MEDDIAIREYSATDKDAIFDLLSQTHLPIEDLTDDKMRIYIPKKPHKPNPLQNQTLKLPQVV